VSTQLYASAALIPGKEPMVPTEKEAEWVPAANRKLLASPANRMKVA
jgi:hypothetical protein